jgi:hypothetical protein
VDKSEQGNKPSHRGTLTSCRAHKGVQIRTEKEATREKDTHDLLNQSGRQVRTRKKTDKAGDSHPLSSVEGEASRIWKEIDRVRDTHVLLSAEGGTIQDTKRNRSSQGRSQSVKHRTSQYTEINRISGGHPRPVERRRDGSRRRKTPCEGCSPTVEQRGMDKSRH